MNSIRIFFYRYFVTYIIFYNNKLIYNNIQVTNCVTKCNKTIGIGRLGLFRIILNKRILFGINLNKSEIYDNYDMAKFEKGNPGKPKGAVSTLTRSFKDALTAAFNELQNDPEANLIAWGKKNTTAFYMVASKLIPTEINHSLDNKVITVIVPTEIENAKIVEE